MSIYRAYFDGVIWKKLGIDNKYIYKQVHKMMFVSKNNVLIRKNISAKTLLYKFVKVHSSVTI